MCYISTRHVLQYYAMLWGNICDSVPKNCPSHFFTLSHTYTARHIILYGYNCVRHKIHCPQTSNDRPYECNMVLLTYVRMFHVENHCAANLAMSINSTTLPPAKERRTGITYLLFEWTSLLTIGLYYRWFCHFDDDEYLNIGTLSTQLRKYDSSRKYYVGHSPAQVGRKPQSLGFFKQFPEAKRRRYFYATGASYCVSAALMRDLEKYFRDSERFVSTCLKIVLTDDFTVGAIIG